MKALYLGIMTNSTGFTSAFKANVSEYEQLSSNDPDFNSKACALADRFKPDLIFIQIQQPNIITQKCAKFLKSTGAFVINWTGDVRHPIPKWYYEIAQHIDLTCFSNMHDVKEFRKEGYSSEFLEIGYDETIYNSEGITYPSREIVFMANNYGYNHFPESNYRIKMIEFLQKNYPVRFGLYGQGWSKCNGNYNSSQLEEAAMIRTSKIGINLSHFNYERYSSDRMLRIMGTGAMCLTKLYNGIELDFQAKNHLDTWETFDELKIKIDFYLSNDTERNRIAKKGKDLMLKSFTFKSMIKNILKLNKTNQI
tara:strand:- start:3570 stop:4496 length:927 start_codon:yes stop_codon:yes gene_type:complete